MISWWKMVLSQKQYDQSAKHYGIKKLKGVLTVDNVNEGMLDLDSGAVIDLPNAPKAIPDGEYDGFVARAEKHIGKESGKTTIKVDIMIPSVEESVTTYLVPTLDSRKGGVNFVGFLASMLGLPKAEELSGYKMPMPDKDGTFEEFNGKDVRIYIKNGVRNGLPEAKLSYFVLSKAKEV